MSTQVQNINKNQSLCNFKFLEECWNLYFDGEFSKSDRKFLLVKHLIECLRLERQGSLSSEVYFENGVNVWVVDYENISKLFQTTDWKIALDTEPSEAISCLELAAHEVLYEEKNSDCPVCVNVRLINYHDSRVDLKNIKANLLGRFVSISGIVVRTTVVKPLVQRLQFQCLRCGSGTEKQFSEGKFSAPKKCQTEGCKSKSFRPLKKDAMKVDFQKIRVQELSVAGSGEARVPRTVECELSQDLVNSCLPGDLVTICGIVKQMNKEMDIGGHGKKSSLSSLFIEANSLIQRNKTRAQREEGSAAIFQFSRPDLEFIVQYAKSHQGDLFKHLVQSICPTIFGNELVKAGMVLSLFGGVRKYGTSHNKVPVRGDIHVLVVGDPGLGKSQLLRSASACVPRGIYVCGNASSAAGLTVAVVKDSLSGDYVFEAGAMVLANGGICCIDEFDKMPSEHQALLEAMEQQSVSVAKAGLVANLSARTSILAAANPVSGHYNRAKTVNENLKMSSALLSRFDLVFILLDSPNVLKDQLLSEHIIALHSKQGNSRGRIREKVSGPQNFLAAAALQTQQSKEGPRLAERLKIREERREEDGFEPLPPNYFRKYVAYARQYVSPRLSKEACTILQAFYLELREHSKVSDGTPITARQLESLVRLAEARARLELREIVTADDAQDVVDLMSESLYHRLVDEKGSIEVGRSGGMSRSKETKRFVQYLCRLATEKDKPLFSRKELADIADDIGLNVPNLDDVIEKMNEAGFLLKKGNGKYEVQP